MNAFTVTFDQFNAFLVNKSVKGLVHPNILSSFTHPQVVLDLHKLLSSVEHKGRYFEECWEPDS